MRIYNPQNQFGKDLVTKELVSQKLLAITGYSLEGGEPVDDLQTQINNIVGGGLKYKVLEKGTTTTEGTWLWLKNLIDTKPEGYEAKVEQYIKTIILVNEGGGKSGNVYTEYLVFDKGTETAHDYAYEKIGEIGGDVEELVKRIDHLEDHSVGNVTGITTGVTAGAITVELSATSGQNPAQTATITAHEATTSAYGVVKLSATGLGESTVYVVTEAQLKAVKDELDGKIEDLTDGTTVAVGQVRVAEVTIENPTTAEHVSGVFSITPKTGAGNVKILTVEDNSGEEWSHKSVAGDTAGVQFQVWNDGTDTTDWDDMDASNRPSGFTVTYVVLTLASA